MNRRGFMAMLGAAPVAAPAIAKEAAAKMGLSPAWAVTAAGYDGDTDCSPVPCYPDDHASWLRGRIRNLFTDEAVQNRRRDARGLARILDPDLAACRSISPSVAYQIQIDRCCERLAAEEKTRLERELDHWLKATPGT